MLPANLPFILALVVFVLAGRAFLQTWRTETPRPRLKRAVYGALCLAAFAVVAFFEVRL